MLSALIVHDVPIECINRAAIMYHIPATLIISVLSVEGGSAGLASPNKNGTFDYGPMQINTIWLNKIKPYGYTREQIQYDPCINVMVGTWILATNVGSSSTGQFWHGVGGYHSYNLPLNERYQYKVRDIYQLISEYTQAQRVKTVPLSNA